LLKTGVHRTLPDMLRRCFVLHAELLLKIILATESVGVIFTLFGLHEFLKGFQVRDDLEFDIFRVFSFFEVTGVFI